MKPAETGAPSIEQIMQTRPAFVIVHISDLHFGGELYPEWTRSAAPLVPAAPPGGARIPKLSDFPHDPGACQELQNVITDEMRKRQPGKALIVVTGDLTRLGQDSEFVLALTFLRSRLQTQWTLGLGLGPYDVEVLVVPGNHDHALGSRSSHIVQHCAPLHGLYFPKDQEWIRTYSAGSLQLEIFGIDSCSSSQPQYFARGGIGPNSLSNLDRLLAAAHSGASGRAQAPLRLLLCHHPPSGSFQGAKQLQNLCSVRNVHFILTGHTHDPSIKPLGTFGKSPLELGCGTTLQGALPGKLPSRYGQTFLIHSVWWDGKVGAWRTEQYQRIFKKGTHGWFTPAGRYETLVTL